MSDHERPLEPAGRAEHKPGERDAHKQRGALAWMAKNSVAANIIMLVLLVGGAVKSCDIKQEVFPEFEMDIIVVNVPYPGASPTEVEQGVLLAAEEAVRSIDGVKQVRSTAAENAGVLVVELMLGTDADQALDEVKAAVDRITSFPDDVERPIVFMAKNRLQVLSVILYGDEDPMVLKALAEKTRDDLLQDPRITVVEVTGVNPLEISIEVAQQNLRRYGLTLGQISTLVSQAARDVPAGSLKTATGEVLLRTRERRDTGAEFGDIALYSSTDGAEIHLRDVADIRDGFAETDIEASYGGQRAVKVNVFRVGKQTPIEISDAVHKYIKDHKDDLPPGVHMAAWFDTSEFYKGRRDLLFKNAIYGLILVMLILGVFLEVRLAFWVTLGIPISFIGSLLLLPSTGVSINMISLFAFIVVLGMVVDDAIIVGESVYRRRTEGEHRLEAAIHGVKEVATPIVFAILTTIIAYTPMLFVPGFMGKFFRVVPIVVIIVLLVSLLESLLILPAHLAHSKRPSEHGVFGWLHHQQQRFSRYLEHLVRDYYQPLVAAATHHRYLTMAACIAVFVSTMGLCAGGRVQSEFFPAVESDVIVGVAELPFGSSIEQTREVHDQMLAAAKQILDEHGVDARIEKGVFSVLGNSEMLGQNDPSAVFRDNAASHVCEVAVLLLPTDERDISAAEFTRIWREKVGEIPGIERIRFKFDTGPASGPPINLEISHPDMRVLRAASQTLAARLAEFNGAYDVDDGFESGKPQIDFRLRPEARAMGLTEGEMARQLRSAFFGAEAVRQQRGRDEVKVYVRLPRSERDSEYHLEEMMIRLPASPASALPAGAMGASALSAAGVGGGGPTSMAGGEIPLRQAATLTRGRSYTSIRRIDGRRAVEVTAELDPARNNANDVMAEIRTQVMPALMADFPGLRYQVGGNARQQDETQASLKIGFLLVLIGIFALLAIAFRSYVQPLIVLLAIPFGIVGAVMGHLLLGYKLSLMSTMGVVALSGVVVNDSLILIVAINRLREDGAPMMEAVVKGGVLRFRPILLTSLTTFFGLAPMMLESSVQARFLIPMAISLGFGVMFATFITLLLIPAAYVIQEDAARGIGTVVRFFKWSWRPGDEPLDAGDPPDASTPGSGDGGAPSVPRSTDNFLA